MSGVKGDVGLYCVIGATVTSSFGRTWKRDREEAVQHARRLITQQSSQKGPMQLFVVQVTDVVETPRPRIDVRPPSEDDAVEMVDD